MGYPSPRGTMRLSTQAGNWRRESEPEWEGRALQGDGPVTGFRT